MSTTLASPELAITTVRTLAIDGVQAANSGHPGAPMGLAPVGWTLFSRHLHALPLRPGVARPRPLRAVGRARVDAPLRAAAPERLRPADRAAEGASASWAPRRPGHPERGDTPGVEITTGPLGQGFANAVGFALAEAMLAARFNRPGHEIVDHRTWFICSDGDLMEGISHEAASIAGFLGLEKLIGIWDDNHISLDGPTSLSFGEDVPARFAAYGWRVIRVEDGNDADAIDAAMAERERARRPPHPDRLPHPHRLRIARQAGHLERARLSARPRRGRRHQARLRLARGRAVPGPRRRRGAGPVELVARGRAAQSRVGRAARRLRRGVPRRGRRVRPRQRGRAARGLGVGRPGLHGGRVDRDAGVRRAGP